MRIIRKVKDLFKSRRVKKLEAVIRQKDERISRLEAENYRLTIALAESKKGEGMGVLETVIDSMARAFHCLTSSIKDIDLTSSIKDIDWNEVEGDSDGIG